MDKFQGAIKIVVFFTDKGRVYKLKGYEIPEAGRTAKGTAIVNLLQLAGGEKITAMIPLPREQEGYNLVMATRNGTTKKTPLEEYRLTKRGAKGVRTVNITAKNGPLVSLCAVGGDEDLLIITDAGIMIRISLSTVSEHGRNTQGVRLINVAENCKVSAMEVVEAQSTAEETPAEPVTEPEEENKETEENA